MDDSVLTVYVPITDADATEVSTLPSAGASNINVIYKHNGVYKRAYKNDSNQYAYQEVVDREFPELGNPLEITNYTYDSSRMGTAPVISAQGVMWEPKKDSGGNSITLKELWTLDCHVKFKGENFYIKEMPTTGKTEKDTRYKYDIDFVSERVVIEDVFLYDVVRPFVTEKPVSESSVFSFYGNIEEFIKRINASFIRSGLAKVAYRDGVTDGSFLTYDEFNAVGIGTYSGSKDTSDPYPAVPDGMQAYVHYPHANIYEHFGGNYTKYLLNRVYYVENPQTVHIGPAGSGYDEIVSGDYIVTGYQCKIGKDKYGNTVTSEEKLISFENSKIHEALQKIKEDFGLQYYVTTQTNTFGGTDTLFVIGDCENDFADVTGTDASGNPIYLRDVNGIPKSTNPFDYGSTDALLSKEISPSNDKLITRITGYGGSENIPWYYPNPTADGWISPIYKRNGNVRRTVAIDYQSTDGDSPADNTLYEKYLKNRIGDVFKFGNPILLKAGGDYVKSASGFTSTRDAIVLRYYLSNITSAINPKLLIGLSLVDNSNASGFTAQLINLTSNPHTEIGSFDSSSSYGNPTKFQQAFLSGKGDVAISLSNNTKYELIITFYRQGSRWPSTNKYDYKGHHYTGDTVELNEDYSVRIPENFYDENSLIPTAGFSFGLVKSGYSVDGNIQSIVNPIQRVEGKKYLDINTGVVYKCLTSHTGKGILFMHSHGQTYHEAVSYTSYSEIEDFDEWVSRFLSLKLSVYTCDGWYSKSKKVSLNDYGITNERQLFSNATVLDTIEFRRLKYVTPQPNLMPEVYIKTDGERRFYDAKNYEPLKTGTPDEAIGEYNPTGTSYISNRIYQIGDSGNHYDFENECRQKHPVEHIEPMEDVKPTIEGQTNTIGGSTLRIDIVEEFAYDELDNDEVWESNDDGNASGEYKHPFFFAKLRPLGFNIFDLALQEDMVLSMTTGHCGACNFKIGVDENTKKNPVEIWEYDVYGGPNYANKGNRIYAAGDIRRYVDSTNLHYDTNGTSDGYIFVDSGVHVIAKDSFLDSDIRASRQATFDRLTYSSKKVLDGEVGSLRQEPKKHFAGDVKIGKFCSSQQDTTENYVWVALYKDTSTYGTIMPSAQPDYSDGNYSRYIEPKGSLYTNRKTGVTSRLLDDDADKFVLLNIKMPQVYLRRAERELSKKLVEYMFDNNANKFKFSITFSRIFLADNESVYGSLNENSVLYIKFDDKIYRQYVSHYSYRRTNKESLPEISVDLNDEISTYISGKSRISHEIDERNRRALNSIKSIIDLEKKRVNREFVSSSGGIVYGDMVFAKAGTSSLESVEAQTLLNKKQEENVMALKDIDNFNDDVTDAFKQVEYTVQRSVSKKDGRWWTSEGKAPLDSISELIVPQRINRQVEKNDFEDESFDESFK